MAKQMFRQGDVLIERVSAPELGAKVKRDKGRAVLAYGEVTGHAHAIAAKGAELYESATETESLEVRFLRVLAEGGVPLRHEEHATIEIPPGDYRITRQREYAPDAIRNVAD